MDAQCEPKRPLSERRGMTTEEEIKQAVASGAFKRETAQYHRETQRELERRKKPETTNQGSPTPIALSSSLTQHPRKPFLGD